MHRRSMLIGCSSLLLAVFVYCAGLGSDHLATNGDELLYAQISKLTAATGQLLPLQSIDEKARNTKPPMLFWQGIRLNLNGIIDVGLPKRVLRNVDFKSSQEIRQDYQQPVSTSGK